MRIERVKHTVNRRFKKRVVIEFFAFDVIAFDDRQSLGNVGFDLFHRHGFGGFCRADYFF